MFSLASLTFHPRWKDSGLSTLMVLERETFNVVEKKTTFETSYYVSNSVIDPCHAKPLAEELGQAVRAHWGVESNNWIRDVTFGEDHIKTKKGNQAQIMAQLRGVGIELIRKISPKNFQATIEKLSNVPSYFESMINNLKVL